MRQYHAVQGLHLGLNSERSCSRFSRHWRCLSEHSEKYWRKQRNLYSGPSKRLVARLCNPLWRSRHWKKWRRRNQRSGRLKRNCYITGATFSANLTTKNPAVASYNAGAQTNDVSNAFVAEFNPTSGALVYATYLGGSGNTGTVSFLGFTVFSFSIGDLGTAIRIDPATGHIWVAGVTASTDFQVPGKVTPVFQSTNMAEASGNAGPPATAGFVAELDTT